tara:strand:- start:1596 stop:1739 length:144 start_codon:yes stop_codon:yes gene_type:complete
VSPFIQGAFRLSLKCGKIFTGKKIHGEKDKKWDVFSIKKKKPYSSFK